MEMPPTFDIEGVRLEVCAALKADATRYLDAETIERRLEPLREAVVLDSETLAAEVVERMGLQLAPDQVGAIILLAGEDKLGRELLLEKTGDPVTAYHTAVHEGVHLLGRDSMVGFDPFDRYAVIKFLGPVSTKFTFDTDEGGTLKLIDMEMITPEEKLFWEAATDYVAMTITADKFGQAAVDDNLTNGAGRGFIQRYWIKQLIQAYPNSADLIWAMKKALYCGDMQSFLSVLGGRSDNRHVPLYHTLAAYMLEGEEALSRSDVDGYRRAFDRFARTVTDHFAAGGAYSLDMTYF